MIQTQDVSNYAMESLSVIPLESEDHGEDTSLTLRPRARGLAAAVLVAPSKYLRPEGYEPTQNGYRENYAENMSHNS